MIRPETVFRHRFWFIALLFQCGFMAAFLDPGNVVVAALEAAGFDADTRAMEVGVHACFGFGALLVVLAAALRTWATAYLTGEVVHDAAVHTERLVSDGPYRRVRNPLYLALLLLVFGFSLAASRLGCAILVVGSLLLVRSLIAYEEAGLLASQGEAFEAYRRAVPRLLPSLLPRIPASARAPRWGQALLAEAFFWVFAAGAVAFAWTLDGWVFGGTCVGGLGVYAVSLLIARRGRRM